MPVFWKFPTFQKILMPKKDPGFSGFLLLSKTKEKNLKENARLLSSLHVSDGMAHICARLYQRCIRSSVVSGQSKSVKALWVNHGANGNPPFPQFCPISFLNSEYMRRLRGIPPLDLQGFSNQSQSHSFSTDSMLVTSVLNLAFLLPLCL